MRLRMAAALGVGVMLGAAGPDGMSVQITDVGPLAKAPAPARTITFQNTMYQAAPVPNVDAAPPNDATQPQTEIAPKLLTPQSLFQGDGFSRGSSQEASLEARKSGAAGLGLNVPVN